MSTGGGDPTPQPLSDRMDRWLSKTILVSNQLALRPVPYQRIQQIVKIANESAAKSNCASLKAREVARHLIAPDLRGELLRQLNAPHHELMRPGTTMGAGYYVGGRHLGLPQCVALSVCLAELQTTGDLCAPVVTVLSAEEQRWFSVASGAATAAH